MRWLGALLLLLVLNAGLKVLAWQESPAPDPQPRFVQVGEVQIVEMTSDDPRGDQMGDMRHTTVRFPLLWLVGLLLLDVTGLIPRTDVKSTSRSA